MRTTVTMAPPSLSSNHTGGDQERSGPSSGGTARCCGGVGEVKSSSGHQPAHGSIIHGDGNFGAHTRNGRITGASEGGRIGASTISASASSARRRNSGGVRAGGSGCSHGRGRCSVRLQGGAAASAACLGILAAYAAWRAGLLPAAQRCAAAPLRAAQRRLAAPLSRLAGRLLAPLPAGVTHIAAALLRLRGGPRSPTERPTASSGSGGGSGGAAGAAGGGGGGGSGGSGGGRACGPGHVVYVVPLPPKRPGGGGGGSDSFAVTITQAPAAGAEPPATGEPSPPADTDTDADTGTETEPGLEVHLVDLQQLGQGGGGGGSRGGGGVEAALAADLGGLLGGDPGGLCAVGLDAEWEPELQPGVRNRISVIQIATAARCWVLRPGLCESPAQPEGQRALTPPEALPAPGLPGCVAALLSDPRIIKAGVGIQEDVRRLERDFGVRVRGAVDIRLVAQAVAPSCLAAGGSLRSLAEALLGRLLDKSAQRSHWGATQLDERQVAYAAHDAWLSRELLLHLHRLHSPDGGPPLQQPPALPLQPPQQRLSQPAATAAAAAVAPLPRPAQDARHTLPQPPRSGLSLADFAAPFLDVFSGFKAKRVEKVLGRAVPAAAAAAASGPAAAGYAGRGAPKTLGPPPLPPPAGPYAGGGEGCGGGGGWAAATAAAGPGPGSGSGSSSCSGSARRVKDHKLPTRKSVLYENCRLLAPDGVVLCTCGAKKVRWYLERGLADVVSEQPTTIQLRFEPRGRGHADDEYYLSDKENRCCVCGSGGEYLRHSVVPHCYRQHFPPSMKSHLSHDIVLLCPPCHKASNMADQRRMALLGEQFDAPLGPASAAKFRHDSSLGAVRSAGRALANTKVVIPPDRRRELEAVVRAHFGLGGGEELQAGHIAQAADVDPRSEDENWRSHAEVVVRALGGRDALEGFVRGWRRHFLDTMAPRFMPPHWRVDARVANSAAPEEEGREQGEDEVRGEGRGCGGSTDGNGDEEGEGEGEGEEGAGAVKGE